MPFLWLWVFILTIACIFLAYRLSVISGALRNIEQTVRRNRQAEEKAEVKELRNGAVPKKPAGPPSPSAKPATAAFSTPVAEKKVPLQAPSPVSGGMPHHSPTIKAVTNFIKGGNIWVTGGIVLLVLGLVFAFSYISMRYQIPGEVKVSGGLLLGFALFVFGWRQRTARHSFGLILQGGSIGIIFLSLFASVKIYDVFPVEIVFPLTALLILLSGVLSVLQNSQLTALFAAVIGFAAPVLLSSGSGKYMALFSYYTLLNLGILGIAFKKYWRYLNAAGFVFTFVVGMAWGLQYYEDVFFLNVEIFLVVFFLIYTAVNILSMLRQTGIRVENAFAVTTSFAYMGIQLGITEYYDYGQAIAAFTLGMFYILLSIFLGRKLREKLKLLITLYLALGVIFVNMSLPLFFSGAMSAGLWAAEGTVLVILGVYQNNRFFRWFGLIVATAAVISSWLVYSNPFHSPFLDGVWVSRFLSSCALLVSSGALFRMKNRENSFLAPAFLLFGAVMWFAAFGNEFWQQGYRLETAYLVLVSFSALLFTLAGRKMGWPLPQTSAVLPAVFAIYLFLPALASFFVSFLPLDDPGYFSFFPVAYLWTDWRWAGWLAFTATYGVLLYIYRRKEGALAGFMRASLFFITVLMFATNIQELSDYIISKADISFFFYGTQGLLFMAVSSILAARLKVFEKYAAVRLCGGGAVVIYLLMWVLESGKYPMQANTWEIANLPLLNPVDGVAAAVMAAIAYWFLHIKYRSVSAKLPKGCEKAFAVAIALTFFYWLHFAIARAVCYYADGYYNINWLFNSGAYQLSVAILWGIAGLTLMLGGHKKHIRAYWTMGAALLAADALKLFLIDLSRVGTLPRIGSFMALGALFIIIGYFVPLPPKEQKI